MELILKTPKINTLAEKNIEAMKNGTFVAGGYDVVGSYEARREAAQVSNYAFGDKLRAGHSVTLDGASAIRAISSPVLSSPVEIDSMSVSGFDFPMPGLNGQSVRAAISSGNFRMEGASLIPSWRSLWDADRIDLTVRKAARATIRELIYNVIDKPDADKTETLRELYDYAGEFKEVSGTGDAVNMMEPMGGETDTVNQKIYALGFTYDLTKNLFDRTLDMSRVNSAIAIAESGLKDDLALSPIFSYSYGNSGPNGDQTTPANTSGATPEDKLYLTIEAGLDGLRARRDPVTSRRIDPSNCVILADPIWARRIARVAQGFMNVSQNVKNRPALDEIGRVVGYEGERIVGLSFSKTYTDVPTGKAYIIVPNRRMVIPVKRTIQKNVDMNPSVLRLAQEETAWWFAEGIYYGGVGYFIQELTLPSWHS